MALLGRRRTLGLLLLAVGVLTLAILSRVLATVFFAITVAYVLYPVRRELVAWSVPRRVAAAAATVVGFVFAVLVVTPIGFALYIRRDMLLAFIQDIPAELPIRLFGMTRVVDVSDLLARAEQAVISVGVGLASAAPVIALKLFLFVILIYGILLRPENVRSGTLRAVPGEYHDVVLALHERVRDTLYALYVLQAATAMGTFVVAYVVFWALGYGAAFSLAVFAGILQFIPVIGPSLLIAVLAAAELAAGNVPAAVIVTAVGLVLVGFLPDAVIRPRLASVTTGMPASLYFVGFTGGTLTLGVVGVIAGPLVVAVFAEVVDLVVDERTSVQTTLDETSGPGGQHTLDEGYGAGPDVGAADRGATHGDPSTDPADGTGPADESDPTTSDRPGAAPDDGPDSGGPDDDPTAADGGSGR